jgi:hypothetical protein
LAVQRAANASDSEDEFVVSKPAPKKAAPKKAKAAVPLPPSDDAMDFDEAPKKVSRASRSLSLISIINSLTSLQQASSSKASSVEPTRAKAKVAKKREVIDLDLSDEEEKKSSPPAKKKKGPVKKAAAKVRPLGLYSAITSSDE